MKQGPAESGAVFLIHKKRRNHGHGRQALFDQVISIFICPEGQDLAESETVGSFISEEEGTAFIAARSYLILVFFPGGERNFLSLSGFCFADASAPRHNSAWR